MLLFHISINAMFFFNQSILLWEIVLVKKEIPHNTLEGLSFCVSFFLSNVKRHLIKNRLFFSFAIRLFQATTDLYGNCTLRHSGTSAAAPEAAGVFALAIEAKYVFYCLFHTRYSRDMDLYGPSVLNIITLARSTPLCWWEVSFHNKILPVISFG